MTTMEISLFHRLRVCDGNGRVSLSATKAQELLCYLLLFRDKAHTREVLAEILWADSSPKQSRGNLRKALWHLKSTVPAGANEDSGPFLHIGPNWVRIELDDDIFVDIDAFEQTYSSVEGVPGEDLSEEQACQLRCAVELYTGDLLEGWYQEWCLHERQRLQFMYLAMLDKLIGYAEANGEYDVGIGYCARVLRHDWARERTHRQLMRLHYLAGDRTAALEQYAQCVHALREDLDVEPDPRTTELYRQIRGQLPALALRRPAAAVAAREPDLAEMLQRLRAHRDSLAAIHRQIDAEIDRINEIVREHQEGEAAGRLPARPALLPHMLDLTQLVAGVPASG